MKALCVDDELLLLETLKRAVESSADITEVAAFDDEFDAIEWAEVNDVDIAFLDIHLHELSGLDLAIRLREKHPDLAIIFCTGYTEYALDAFKLHASGYLTKPIKKADVQREINHVNGLLEKKPLIKVRKTEDGDFEAFGLDGKPLPFKRSPAKDVLGILVVRNGVSISSREIAALLWPRDKEWTEENKDYLKKIFRDLNHALESVGAADVLLHTVDGYLLDMSRIRVE